MTTKRKMLFPFTNKDEILDWADRYTKEQSDERQCQEEDVIKIEKNVKSRQTHEKTGGYLTKCELIEMGAWKRWTLPSKIENNPDGRVEKITAEAFGLCDDWKKLEKLTSIEGVGESVASVILHLYDEGDYPILDVHALWSLTIDHNDVFYDEPFWKEYVEFCQAKAECHGVCMRKLDQALWKFSASGAASALKNISDEMLFLELKRRGSSLSRLQLDENTGKIVKIG